MNKEYNEIFNANRKSPLFTRVANDLIQKNALEEALSVLEEGVELFENYPTPFFMLGNLYAKLGKNFDANNAFEKGNILLNNSETINYYLDKIYESNFEVTNNDDSEFESNANIDEMPKLEVDGENNQNSNEKKLSSVSDTDDLVELADKLKTAKIEISHTDESAIEISEPQNKEDFKPLKGLVSETLASIYFNQANYKEAKAIYETLVEIQPEREDHFKQKITEIELKMKTRKSDDA